MFKVIGAVLCVLSAMMTLKLLALIFSVAMYAIGFVVVAFVLVVLLVVLAGALISTVPAEDRY